MKIGPDEKVEFPEAPLGAGRKACVDEREWDFAPVGDGGQVRPDFRFDEDDAARSNDRESAAHDRPEIERGVEYFDPGRGLFAGKGPAGGGGGGQDDSQCGIFFFHPGREFERDHHFADTDRMQPGGAGREPGACCRVVEPQALAKLVAVISAPEHFHEVAREKEEKREREEEVVEEADHAREGRGSARVSRAGGGVSPRRTFPVSWPQASALMVRKVREGETPSPARETRALPGGAAERQTISSRHLGQSGVALQEDSLGRPVFFAANHFPEFRRRQTLARSFLKDKDSVAR